MEREVQRIVDKSSAGEWRWVLFSSDALQEERMVLSEGKGDWRKIRKQP